MTPLTGDVMQSFEQGLVDDNACTHPGPQNDSENTGSILAGTINGLRIEWFKNGQKTSEAIWKNSRPVGIETHWNEDGDVIKTTTHKEDEEIE